MIKKHITGIQRASVFSPNHIGNDAAIFTGVAEYIKEKGFDVVTLTEHQFLNLSENPEYVFTMMRDKNTIKRLQQWEAEGCISVNSSFGIENCGRENMTKILRGNNIPYPDSIITDTNEFVIPLLKQHNYSSCWIKRNDVHAIHREDVTFARHPEEVQDMLAEYSRRGINRIVINKHLEGDLVKFYGIAGASFFHWFYPFDNSHSKFGYEQVNGKTKGIRFDKDELLDICDRAAKALDLAIYGGDCIVSPDGDICIIDFNDWPSFAPCRKEAIPFIGDCIINAYH